MGRAGASGCSGRPRRLPLTAALFVLFQPQSQKFPPAAARFRQPDPAVLIGSPARAPALPGLSGAATDTEHSAHSEGSQDTGDSGRFSHESSAELRLSAALSGSPWSSGALAGGAAVANQAPPAQGAGPAGPLAAP